MAGPKVNFSAGPSGNPQWPASIAALMLAKDFFVFFVIAAILFCVGALLLPYTEISIWAILNPVKRSGDMAKELNINPGLVYLLVGGGLLFGIKALQLMFFREHRAASYAILLSVWGAYAILNGYSYDYNMFLHNGYHYWIEQSTNCYNMTPETLDRDGQPLPQVTKAVQDEYWRQNSNVLPQKYWRWVAILIGLSIIGIWLSVSYKSILEKIRL